MYYPNPTIWLHGLNFKDFSCEILKPYTVKAYYKGEFQNEKPHGKGTLFFVNGEFFKGRF